ncbi:unnamed protein product, partial [Hapterophycus canaliculatus]
DSGGWRGVSVKGYATLSRADDGWTRRAETVRLESESSSVVPHFRRTLEAFGELLESKALQAWGRRGSGGRLEASARYTWERRLYDGRVLGEGGNGEGWQASAWWRGRFLRERSHHHRGARDCAIRSLLAAAEGEHGLPSWGSEEDPLDGVRVTAVWRGLGADRPLPHAPLQLLGGRFFLPPARPGQREPSSRWSSAVSWEVRTI